MAKTKRGRKYMIFGKYINKYYLKNAPILILGLAALILVDYFQLFIGNQGRADALIQL